MNDRIVESIADFAADLTFQDLSPTVISKAADHLIDSIGCAFGGFDSPPARIASRLTPDVCSTRHPGHVLGEPDRLTTAADAAFLNTVRIRYLDYNDTYPGGHPSDVLGPLLAMAPEVSGGRLLTAMVTAYEVFNRLCVSAQLREKGWDQGCGIGLATCAGLGNMLGMGREQIRHALALTAVANVPTRATRAGRLSMWKGCATAMAARLAVDCTLLAMEGMDGPERPVEGRHGLIELVTGPLELPPFGLAEADFWILRSNLKFWPVEYHLQAAVWAALELRERTALDDLEGIHIQTYWSMWHETASESRKWHPDTRETADHSLPYVLIRAMKDGFINEQSFDEAAYRDERTLELMKLVTADVDDAIQARFPHEIELRAVAECRDGSREVASISNPLGHSRNPMGRTEIEDKFRRLGGNVHGETQLGRILDAWWQVSDRDSLRGLLNVLDVAIEPKQRGQLSSDERQKF